MQNAARIDRIGRVGHFLKLASVRSWFLYELSKQKDNIFLWLPVFLAFGIGLYFILPFEPPIALCVFIEIISFIFLFYVRAHSNNRMLALFSLAIFIISSGFLAGKVRTEHIHTPMLTKKHGPVNVSGIIQSLETMEEGGGSRIILSSVSIEDLDAKETPRKIRLRLRKDEGIYIGQSIRALALLNPPSAPLAPDSFDFRRYLYFQGIGAVGFIYNKPEIIEGQRNSFSIINSVRQAIAQRILDVLPHQEASVAMALMVGQKNALSSTDRQAIRDAGLAHMLAISGLHVGLVASVLFYIIRLVLAAIPSFALRYSIKNIAAIITLLGTITYMLLAGATVPTQRATLMTAIVFLAILLDRNPFSLRLVAFSAFVILLHSPESLMSASFHMSYAAVTCLIYFYECTREFWMRAYRKKEWYQAPLLYFLGVCFTTVIASIATAPFSLYHFGQVSFIGSIANLIAVPLLAFIIMPAALLSLLSMIIGLEYWPLQLVSFGIGHILDISYWAASLPAAILQAGTWSFGSFLLLTSSCLFMILWKSWGKLLGLPVLCLSLILINAQTRPDILVSSSHKLFAVRSDDTLYVSSRRSERFVIQQWEKYYGLPAKSAQLLPYKGEGKYLTHDFLDCGAEGCRFTIKGQRISIIRSSYILREECRWADLVISPDKINQRLCPDTVTIGKFDTWEFGAHAVSISNGGIDVRTVAQDASNRPWSAYHTKALSY